MKEEYKELKELQKRYLTRLSDLYPTIAAASTEIINLQAILNLPKGTEHFLTDVHGRPAVTDVAVLDPDLSEERSRMCSEIR